MKNPRKFAVFALAAATIFSACYAPPNPPMKAPMTAASVLYATFEEFAENDFKRISEYFTDRENDGGNLILRTDANRRAGQYLVIGLAPGTKIPAGTVIELNYCLPATTGFFTAKWRVPAWTALPEREILIGVTNAKVENPPNAWRFSIVSPGGTVVAERKSFLWHEYNGAENASPIVVKKTKEAKFSTSLNENLPDDKNLNGEVENFASLHEDSVPANDVPAEDFSTTN